MLFVRRWCQVGPVAIVLLLAAELLVDLAHDMVPRLGMGHRHLWLDAAQLGTTIVVLALAARRVRQARTRQRRQSRHYARLTELGHAALRETDVKKIYQRCATLMVDVLKCDAAAFVECDTQGKRWRTQAVAGRLASKFPKDNDLPWGPGHFGDYVLHTTAQPVHVFNFADEHRFVPPKQFNGNSHFAGALAIRIHLESCSHGILSALFHKPTACDSHCANYLRSVGVLLTRYLQAHQAHCELQRSEALFEQLTEHIQEVFYVASADHSKMHYISPAYEKIWQASAAALYRNPNAWLDAIHADDRTDAAEMLKNHAFGSYFERTYRVVRGDGTVRWICDRSFPIQEPKWCGLSRGWSWPPTSPNCGCAQDIVSQLALADERTARAKAETHIRTRDEVLAIVSHDLRTPLSGISLAAQRLIKHCQDDAKAMRLAGKIEHAVGRMERLVQDLMEVSRLESGVLRLEQRSMSAGPSLARGHGCLRGSRWQGNGGVLARRGLVYCVSVDGMRILQVLGNLISNAVTFTPAGGTVTVSAQSDGETICFSVVDAGPGISAEQSERLFEPFWQGLRHDKGGMGLGLHIAKGIVDAHGGAIGARSAPSGGTVVWFSLPVEMVETQEPSVPEMPAMDATLN